MQTRTCVCYLVMQKTYGFFSYISFALLSLQLLHHRTEHTEKTCLINEINFFSILFHFRLFVCALVLDSNLSCLKVSYKNFKCASIILKINSSMERPVSDKIKGNKIFILDLCFRRVQLYPVF